MSEEIFEQHIAPPSVRFARGEVRRDPVQIDDVRGAVGHPYRVLSTLATMLNREKITKEMEAAGIQFHCQFVVACLHAIRAADMGRTPVEGMRNAEMPRRIYTARDWVWEALKAMGGLTSPCGSISWGVLGLEMTIEGWAKGRGWHGKPMKRETASGLLIGALGVLVAIPPPDSD